MKYFWFVLGLQFFAIDFAYSKPPTGKFISDARPNELTFIYITAAGSILTGNVTKVKPNGKGGTSSEIFTLVGNGDSNGFTATATENGLLGLIGMKFVMNGRIEGERLNISIPTSSGSFYSFDLTPSNEQEFNKLLKTWQKEIWFDYQHNQLLLAKQQSIIAKNEKEDLFLSEKTLSLRNNFQQISKTEIPSNIASIKKVLASLSENVDTLRNDLAELTVNASDKSLSCDRLKEKTELFFNDRMIKIFENAGENKREFLELEFALKKRIENGKAIQQKIRADNFELTVATLKSERYRSSEKLQNIFDEHSLETYSSIVDSADRQLPGWKKNADEFSLTVKTIMRDGVLKTKEALKNSRCR